MKPTGYDFIKIPKYNWDCTECKFITSLKSYFPNGDIHFTDVYKSCTSLSEDSFIFVFSNELSDYASGITLNNLFAGYNTYLHS